MAERWADLARALSIYPDNNFRVSQSVEAFMAALRHDLDARAKPVEVGFSSTCAWVAGQAFDVARGSGIEWLKDRLDRADLAGARFVEGVTAASMLAFTKRLLELYRRSDLTLRFGDLWGAQYEGITLIERRFDGAFTENRVEPESAGPAPPPAPMEPAERPRSLQDALNGAPRIRARIQEIQSRILARAGRDSEFQRVDLVAEIAALLPVEALHDEARAAAMTENALAALEARLIAGDIQPRSFTHGTDAAFRKLLFAISRSHFQPHEGAGTDVQWAAIEPTRPGAAAGAAEDTNRSAHDADVDGLFADMAQIRTDALRTLRPDEVEDPAEQLGVVLHYVVSSEDPDEVPGLWRECDRVLRAAGRAGTEVLRQYLDPREPAEATAAERGRVRLAAWLRRNGHRAQLAQCGILDAAWASREFPSGFAAYVRTLDLDHAEDREELDLVCQEIGRDRLEAATGSILDSDAMRDGGVARLFDLSMRSLTPLACGIWMRDKSRHSSDFARFLRMTVASPIDKAILEVGGPAHALTSDYLLALACQDDRKVERHRCFVVLAALRATECDPDRIDQHLAAIRLLGHFDTPAARSQLQRLIGERELLVLKRHPREVRAAAAGVLRSFDRKGGRRGV